MPAGRDQAITSRNDHKTFFMTWLTCLPAASTYHLHRTQPGWHHHQTGGATSLESFCALTITRLYAGTILKTSSMILVVSSFSEPLIRAPPHPLLLLSWHL